MNGWNEVINIPAGRPTTLQFDANYDLLWCGDQSGYMTSYSSSNLNKYTSFRSGPSSVLQTLTHDSGILSLGTANINFNSARGLPRASLAELAPNFNKLTCFEYGVANNNSTLMVNSANKTTFKVDLNKPSAVQTVDYHDTVAIMKRSSKLLVMGNRNGSVDIFDPVSNKTVKKFYGHNGILNDLDVSQNLIVTCGGNKSYTSDPLVNLYDIRMMKPMNPIPFPTNPYNVRFHPKFPNVIVISNGKNQLNFIDIYDQSINNLYQVNIDSMANLCLSTNGDFLSFSDSFDNVHLWSYNKFSKFNNFNNYLELPDFSEPAAVTFDGLAVSDTTPLSSVGFPYYKELLLSNYPANLRYVKALTIPAVTSSSEKPMLRNTTYPYKSFIRKQKNQFLSEKSSAATIVEGNNFEITNTTGIPSSYSKYEIMYSKFGVQDFDFKFYNKTEYSGLENQSKNSGFINSLLQIYNHMPDFHNIIVDYLSNTENYSSSLVQLGYLFDMLYKSEGKNVNPKNFLDWLSKTQLNSQLETSNITDIAELIFKFNYFLVNDLINEEFQIQQKSEILKKFTFMEIQLMNNSSFLANLQAFFNANGGSVKLNNNIVINIRNPQRMKLATNWIIDSFNIQQEKGVIYKLFGYVAEIRNEEEKVLISYVKKNGLWYMFNDFLVIQVDEREVLSLNSWKSPLMLMYTKEESIELNAVDVSKLDCSILYHDTFNTTNKIIEYELLTESEAPKPNTLVAIDTEFVILEPEKLEIRSDGFRQIVKPKEFFLARVSVLRGEGTKKGVPFIDDYIMTREHIHDYLTTFSGIEPGDLDPETSKRPLVSHEIAYRKLWLLLHFGVIFVGHALSSDFRQINLFVPQEQIRDTADFFYISEYRRKLGLKFLAYVLLNSNVQVGNHSSIEDAMTALQLYDKYLELKETGQFEEVLNWVYKEGARLRFRAE